MKHRTMLILFLFATLGYIMWSHFENINSEVREQELGRLSMTLAFVKIGGASGFIINKVDEFERKVYILTAYHVVDQFDKNEIPIYIPEFEDTTLKRHVKRTGKLIKFNKEIDYAILEAPWDFHCMKVKVGIDHELLQEIYSVGRPNGKFRISKGHITELSSYIGHNAGMYYGSSGGPLFDKKYRVIGINRAVGSYHGMLIGFIGFAIKMSYVLEDLTKDEYNLYFGG